MSAYHLSEAGLLSQYKFFRAEAQQAAFQLELDQRGTKISEEEAAADRLMKRWLARSLTRLLIRIWLIDSESKKLKAAIKIAQIEIVKLDKSIAEVLPRHIQFVCFLVPIFVNAHRRMLHSSNRIASRSRRRRAPMYRLRSIGLSPLCCCRSPGCRLHPSRTNAHLQWPWICITPPQAPTR